MQFKGLIKPAELSPFHSLKWMKYASLQGVSILDCKLPLFRVSKDFISYSLTGWQKRIANWSFSVTGCLEIANFDCKLTFFLTGWSMILSKVGQLWLQTRHFWECLKDKWMNFSIENPIVLKNAIWPLRVNKCIWLHFLFLTHCVQIRRWSTNSTRSTFLEKCSNTHKLAGFK